jgi:hypothetical protein
MSAEIGGYQSDFGDREPVGPGPVASAACEHDEPSNGVAAPADPFTRQRTPFACVFRPS